MEKAAPTIPDSKKAAPLKKEKNPGVEKEKTADVAKKNERKIFKAAVIDAKKLVEAQAKDIGDHRMTETKEDRSKSLISRKLTQIWKHNLFQEYYRQREIAKARGEILSSENLYKGEDAGALPSEHAEAMNAIIARFTSEYEDEMLKGAEKATKQNKNLGANAEIKKLVEAYAANPKMTKEEFKRAQNEILGRVDKDYVKKDTLYADNIFTIAEEVRDAVAHGEKLEEMDFEVELTLGKAQESLNTEAKQTWFEKMQNSKVGRVVMNEPTVAAACAVAYGIASKLSQRFASSKLAAWGSFGATAALSGSLSAAKEAARLNRERAQHSREKAKGKVFDEKDMPRREEMEKNRYLTREASAIQAKLAAALEEVKAGRLDASTLPAIMADLTDLETRVRLGDQKKIDLVTYSNAKAVEQERMALDLARAELKVALRNAGAEKLAGKAGSGTFDEYLDKMVSINTDALMGGENGIEAKDKMFRKMKRSKAAQAFVKTAVAGVVLGVGFQEAKDIITGSFGGEDGLVTGMVKSTHDYFSKPENKWGNLSEHTSALEGLRRFMMHTDARMPMGTPHEVVLGSTHMNFPEGTDITPNPDGTYSIMRGGQAIADHIKLGLDAHGDLTDEAKAALAGSNIYTHSFITPGAETGPVSADDYAAKHAESMHRIHRQLWYDNDTPKPVYDKNELKEWWGKGAGVDKDGNYVFSMKHMTADGSYHGAESVDAQAKMPHLKMLFSLSKGTQHQVFEVPIDADGNAVIPKDSEVAKLMFETGKDGHAVFTGQFAEVAESTGIAKDGGENFRILSTVVGHGHDTVQDAGPAVTINYDIPKDWQPDAPFAIPIVPRTPLERGKDGIKNLEDINKFPPDLTGVDTIPYYYTSGYTAPEDLLKRYEAARSESLKNNPDAKLDVRTETAAYFSHQDPEYVKELVATAKDMGPMNPECSTVICIPVAGHQEGDNIYSTLQNYSHQTADPKTYEIVLLVNRPEKDKAGNLVSPDTTFAEIERFRKDYPNMPIRVAEKILPLKDANIGHIRKYLNDATLLRNQGRGTEMKDIIMVSNDADNKGVAPEYIQNFTTKFNDHENVDAMLGQLDWDPDSYVRNPLVHIGTRLFQYIEVQSRQKGWHIGSSGANFAFRSSIYAGVGGYSDGIAGGEDTDFGERIKQARQGSHDRMPIAYAGTRTSRIYTSSRRAEKVLKDGLSPIEQWDKGFSAFDDEVRKVKWENEGVPVDFKNEEQKKALVSNLQTVINRTIARTKSWGGTANDPLLARSLGWLGVKYEVVDDHSIKITDSTKLLESLEKYQKEGLAILNQKKGPKKVSTKAAPEALPDRKDLLEASRKKSQEAQAENKEEKEEPAEPVAPTLAAAPAAIAPAPATVEASPENGEKRMESGELKNRIRKALEESLRNGGSGATIDKLEVLVNDGNMVVRSTLNSPRIGGGHPEIEMTLGVRKGNKLVFEGEPTVKKNVLAGSGISKAVDLLPESIIAALAGGPDKKIEDVSFSGSTQSMNYRSL